LGSAKTRWPRSAPGLDGITVERVIRAPEVALFILFIMILASAYHPFEWRTMRTVMVPKGGNREDPLNWRPITIGSSLQQLLHRIVHRRMDGLVTLNKNQRGFVCVDGTLANVLVLQIFLDYNSTKRRLHALASLDLRKALTPFPTTPWPRRC
jgi:hypothetical protein